MKEKIAFVRLPLLLVIIFFVGRLIIGFALGPNKTAYDLSSRVFSMVILQVHVGLLWGAVGRRYRGYRVGGAITVALIVTIVSQILIFAATALSYVTGVDTLFNFPEALNAVAAVPFGEALIRRTATFIANCVIAVITGSIGWSLGGLLPEGGPVKNS